jgi:hypothetical protein
LAIIAHAILAILFARAIDLTDEERQLLINLLTVEIEESKSPLFLTSRR